MRVLIITGDKRFGPGHERYELQKTATEELDVVYWGRGALRPRIPKGQWDVVTAQDPFWRGHVAWHIARRLKARLNIQVHTDLSAQPFVRRVFARINLRRADSVRVVSEKIKQHILKWGVRAPIVVLPVFIDIERFKHIERRPEAGLVLWMGRFEQEKDPLLALRVLKDIPDARLVMLGAGSLGRTLEERAKGLKVEFPGWQDPASYLVRASVVLSTSRHESFGASIVEALAAGVPVVAPDVGVAKEAGARVVPRRELSKAVSEALHSGVRGELKLTILNKEEWVRAWVKSL